MKIREEQIRALENQNTAFYERVSTEEQADNTSLSAQEESCMRVAQKYNLKVIHIYKEDKSAMKMGKRKEFNKMIEEVEKENIKIIICAYPDRLTRNGGDGDKIIELIESKKLIVIFAEDGDILQAPLEPHEYLLLETRITHSNYRVRLDKQRCLLGIKTLSLSGYRPNRDPYGYSHREINGKKFVVLNKQRAEFVIKAFELYASGEYSIQEVIDTLYELGYRYELQKTNKIPKASLISMLKNPFYTGYYTVKQTGDIVRGTHEAIITKETFEKVQEILGTKPKAQRKHDLLFSELIKCEKCGHFLIADVKQKENGKTYIYYRCRNPKCTEKQHIKETLVEEDLMNYLKEIKLNCIPDDIVKTVLKEELYPMKQRLSVLKRNVNHKYADEIRTYKFIIENNVTNEEHIQGLHNEIIEKYGNLDLKISTAEKNISLIETKTKAVMQKSLKDIFPEMNNPSKRKVLELITNSFKCTSKGLKITFKSAFRKIRKR